MVYRIPNINVVDTLAEGISASKDIDTELHDFFTNELKDGSLVEWVVEENDVIIAMPVKFIVFKRKVQTAY